MSTTTTAPGKVITGPVRISYAHLFEATAMEEGDTPKFSTAIIIPKDDTDTIDKINGVVEAIKSQVKAKNNGKLPAKFKLPLRDGDEDRPDDEAYQNAYFLNCSSKTKPGIVSTAKDKEGKWIPITDETLVYSGCYCRVSINFYPFDTKGNKGIAVGLNNVQKLRDGDPLAGRSSANDDFDDDITADDDLM